MYIMHILAHRDIQEQCHVIHGKTYLDPWIRGVEDITPTYPSSYRKHIECRRIQKFPIGLAVCSTAAEMLNCALQYYRMEIQMTFICFVTDICYSIYVIYVLYTTTKAKIHINLCMNLQNV